jgi:hypothetical protein
MAFRRTWTLAAVAAALAVVAPSALADTPLPAPQTHIDGAGVDSEAPKLTFLDPDTDAADVRRGYLYLRARCDARCVVEVSAKSRIAGKWREIATATKTLPANKVRRIKLRIRSDVRRRIAAGAKFRFEVFPFPPFDG